MPAGFAKRQAMDEGVNLEVDFPLPFKALQSTSSSPLVSSVVTFHENATDVEVTTGAQPVIIRWGSASVTSQAFDHSLPANWRSRYVIPQSVQGGGGSIVGKNVLNGLYPAMAVMTLNGAAGSVLVATYG